MEFAAERSASCTPIVGLRNPNWAIQALVDTRRSFCLYFVGSANREPLAKFERRLTLLAMKEPSSENPEQPLSKEAQEAEEAAARMDRIYRFCSKIAYVGIALWALSSINLWMRTH